MLFKQQEDALLQSNYCVLMQSAEMVRFCGFYVAVTGNLDAFTLSVCLHAIPTGYEILNKHELFSLTSARCPPLFCGQEANLSASNGIRALCCSYGTPPFHRRFWKLFNTEECTATLFTRCTVLCALLDTL